MNTPSIRRSLPVIFVLCALLGAWAGYRLLAPVGAEGTEPFRLTKQLMGTSWSIQVVPGQPSEPPVLQGQIEKAFDEVARIELVMSEWIPDSPISRVNQSAGNPPVDVPDELHDIILRSHRFSQRSQGAFDISWKGLGNLWRLGDPDFLPPDQQAIDQALSRVDYRNILVEEGRVGLSQAGMAIGLGGIAKGYAVDRAASVLHSEGLHNFYIDGGGDVLVSGSKNGEPWRVGVRHPREPGLLAVLRIHGGAVVTSGDYERFREVDGKRYHHILDPRTGRPAEQCQAVTIVAPETETADALATAAFVLGPREGLDLIGDYPGVEALFVDARGQLVMTDGFRRMAQFELPP